ncbi:hypothetical protein [Zooshikella harenae]|uniref:Uncharacterized protein n=1 Tax=Zooshikella harenae TaxID=2827238 RepID=A0ABS5ZK47_9GAMM|nr:hypothetical protein [Zooshikella harenae]MBU2714268.1 hypothetical protein [Zooshikella harenae]
MSANFRKLYLPAYAGLFSSLVSLSSFAVETTSTNVIEYPSSCDEKVGTASWSCWKHFAMRGFLLSHGLTERLTYRPYWKQKRRTIPVLTVEFIGDQEIKIPDSPYAHHVNTFCKPDGTQEVEQGYALQHGMSYKLNEIASSISEGGACLVEFTSKVEKDRYLQIKVKPTEVKPTEVKPTEVKPSEEGVIKVPRYKPKLYTPELVSFYTPSVNTLDELSQLSETELRQECYAYEYKYIHSYNRRHDKICTWVKIKMQILDQDWKREIKEMMERKEAEEKICNQAKFNPDIKIQPPLFCNDNNDLTLQVKNLQSLPTLDYSFVGDNSLYNDGTETDPRIHIICTGLTDNYGNTRATHEMSNAYLDKYKRINLSSIFNKKIHTTIQNHKAGVFIDMDEMADMLNVQGINECFIEKLDGYHKDAGTITPHLWITNKTTQ